MSNLRRYFRNGDFAFITIVTHKRKSIVIKNIDILSNAIQSIQSKSNFEIMAHVYLPDHIHLLIDSKGNDLTRIIQRIKMSFGTQYRILNNLKSGRVWQNRYWDHIIRDEVDLNNHIDYIHYNPVKHGLVGNPFEWEYSSIHRYKDSYQNDWGYEVIDFKNEYGE